MKHWAYNLIGAPYMAGASGPDAFDCIGLVRYYFRNRHGIELPDYRLLEHTPKDLYRFVRSTGWKRVQARPQEDDVVTMDGFDGKHVGVMIRCSEGLSLLHAVGKGNRGSVVRQHLGLLLGYKNFETWRRA